MIKAKPKISFPFQVCKLSMFCWHRWELCIGGVQLLDGGKEKQPHLYLADLSKATSWKWHALQHQQQEVGESRRRREDQGPSASGQRHLFKSNPPPPELLTWLVKQEFQPITSFISDGPQGSSDFCSSA